MIQNNIESLIKTIFDVKLKLIENLEEKKKDRYYFTVKENTYELDTKDENIISKIKELIIYELNCYEEQLGKQARENFINDIIKLKFRNIDLMLNRSEILGFDFHIKRIAILVEVVDMYQIFTIKNEMILQKFKEEFYEIIRKSLDNKDDIVSFVGDNKFVICKSDEKNIKDKIEIMLVNLKKTWKLEFKISIGDSYDTPGLEAIAHSYKDSENYLKLGKKYLPEKNIYDLKELGAYVLFFNLSDFEKDKMLKYITSLIEYAEITSFDIEGFLNNLFKNNFNLAKTERDLELSKGFAKKSIDNIKEISGLDPVEFEDAVKLYIAFKIANY